ncbi:MAG: hypothetical protein AAFY56_07980 [Pseudomonadota bacterium]
MSNLSPELAMLVRLPTDEMLAGSFHGGLQPVNSGLRTAAF